MKKKDARDIVKVKDICVVLSSADREGKLTTAIRVGIGAEMC